MANLEIKVDTGDAADKLAELAAGLDKAGAAADKAAPSFDKLDEATKKTADVKPIDQAVPDSIDKTGEAAKKLGETAVGVDNAAVALGKVGETAGSLSSVAAAAEQAAAAIEKTAEASTKAGQASAGLGQFSENAHRSAEATKTMENATASADSAFASIGQQALHAAEHMTGFGGAAGFVSKAFSTIMEVGGGLPGVLAGIATAIAAIDFSKISEEALKAAMQVENLQRALNVWSKDAHQAPEALEILDKTADRLGLNLEKLEKNFGKFASTAMSAGFSAKFAATAFDAVENAARASGQGMAGAQRVLNTLDIWMANGTMTAGMLGRSLKEVGMTLDQIDPKFKGLSRNTALPVEAFNKLLIAMTNIKTVELTLQEQTERVANSWTMMLAAFGRGQMDSEVDSMKTLADTMHHAATELNSFSYVAGALWGVLQSLFNYIEAAAVGAFAGLIEGVTTVWNVLSKATFVADDVKAAFSGIASAASWLGGILAPLAHEILPTLTFLAQTFVIGLYALHAAFREFGEDVGILAGAIAGMLYNAFFKVIDALKSFIDWMDSGLNKIKEWMSSGFPEWLSGPLVAGINKVQGFFKSIRDEWNEGVNAAAALRNETEQLTPALQATGDAAAEAARKQAQLTLENEKLAKSAKDATAAEIAKRAAMIFAEDRVWNGGSIFPGRPGGASSSPSSSGGGGGGSGMRDDFTNNMSGAMMSSLLQNAYLQGNDKLIQELSGTPRSWMGGQVGPQQEFNNQTGTGSESPGNAAGQAAFARFQEQKQVSDAMQRALNEFNRIPDFLKESTQQQINAETKLEASLAQTDDGIRANTDKMGELVTGQDAQIAAEQDAAGNLIDFTQVMGAGMNQLGQQLDAAGTAVVDNTQAVDTNSMRTAQETTAVQQNTYSQDANTDATQADTAANYVDAAAQGGGSGGGGGGGGGGTNIDPNGNGQGNPATQSYFDVGGIVGMWGGRLGPAVPASAWVGAKHFADGGLTDGGQPIIAHPNEAIIPLQGGAVPVRLNMQGFADVGEKIIMVGTVAHEDAQLILAQITKIANGETNLLAAFNAAASAMEAAAARSSAGSIASSGISSSVGVGGSSAAGGSAAGSDGFRIRGSWGTSTIGGYLPYNQTNVYTGLGGGGIDALGRRIQMNGAADGLENTNMLPGMSSAGVPITVHANEAIIPLPDGRSVPVHFTGDDRGGGSQRGGGGRSMNNSGNVHVNMTVNAKDEQSFKRSQDQIMQNLDMMIRRSRQNIGVMTLRDDPTVRTGTMGTPNVRGTVIS